VQVRELAVQQIGNEPEDHEREEWTGPVRAPGPLRRRPRGPSHLSG
jgi:hypothetical protein